MQLHRFFTLLCSSLLTTAVLSQPIRNEVGAMPHAKANHTTVLLDNGNVLSAGGDNGFYQLNAEGFQYLEIFATAEIYNAAERVWEIIDEMLLPRTQHGMIKLNDGKVMCIGGYFQKDPDDRYILISTASTEIYNPTTKNWTYGPPLKHPDAYIKAYLLPNGNVLAIGREHKQLFDPAANQWKSLPSFHYNRGTGYSSVQLSDGTVMVSGGSGSPRTVEIFDPVTMSWIDMGMPLKYNRYRHETVLMGGRVLIVGSAYDQDDWRRVEVYRPGKKTTDVKSQSLEMIVQSNPLAVLPDGTVVGYGMGDIFRINDSKAFQSYNPSEDTWSALDYGPIGVDAYAITKLKDGSILVSGGGLPNVLTSRTHLISQEGQNPCDDIPLEFEVDMPDEICYGKDLSVRLQGVESITSYHLKLENGVGLSFPQYTFGSTLEIEVPSERLNIGENKIQIIVSKSYCNTRAVDVGTVNVTRSDFGTIQVDSSGTLHICDNAEVTLSVDSSISNVKWSNGTFGNSISVGQASTQFAVQLDETGCAVAMSEPLTITVRPSFTDGGSSKVICQNTGEVELDQGLPIGGYWSGLGVSSDGVFSLDSVPGIYTLAYHNCSDSDIVNVTVREAPYVEDFFLEEEVNMCPGNAVVVNTSITKDDTQLHDYEFSYLDGKPSEAEFLSDPFGNSSAPGRYYFYPSKSPDTTTTFMVKGVDRNYCGTDSVVKYVTIQVHPYFFNNQEILAPDTICYGQKLPVELTNSRSGYDYSLSGQWNGEEQAGTGDTLEWLRTGNSSGKYGLYVKNDLGCSELVQTFSVPNFYHEIGFSVGDDFIVGESIPIENTSNGSFATWTTPGAVRSIDSIFGRLNALTYDKAGPYDITLKSTSEYGCHGWAKKTINIYESEPPISATRFCAAHGIDFKGETITAFHVDLNGNHYIATFLYDGSQGGGGAGHYKQCIYKFGPDGELKWQEFSPQTASSTFYSNYCNAITSDENGNVYFGGNFAAEQFQLGEYVTPSLGMTMRSSYISKMNSNMEVQWVITANNNNYDMFGFYETGCSGLVFVPGMGIVASFINPGTIYFTDGFSMSLPNIFTQINLVTIDTNGTFIGNGIAATGEIQTTQMPTYTSWNMNNARIARPSLQLTSDTNIAVIGRSYGSVQFPNQIGTNKITGRDFCAFADSDLNWISSMALGSSDEYSDKLGSSTATSSYVSISPNGEHVYYAGTLQLSEETVSNYIAGDGLEYDVTDGEVSYLAKYSTSGELEWNILNNQGRVKGLAYDERLDLIVRLESASGKFSQIDLFGNSYMTQSHGGADLFITYYDTNGALKSMDRMGSFGEDRGLLMASDACGNLHVLSSFDGVANLANKTGYADTSEYVLMTLSTDGQCQLGECGLQEEDTTSLVLLYHGSQYSNSDSLSFTVVATGQQPNISPENIVIENGTLIYLEATEAGAQFLVSPSLDGIVRVHILSDPTSSMAKTGQESSAKTSNVVEVYVKRSRPKLDFLLTNVNSVDGTWLSKGPARVQVNSPDSIVGLSFNDIAGTGNVTFLGYSYTSSGMKFMIDLAIEDNDRVSLYIPGNVYQDKYGNWNLPSDTTSFGVDTRRPTYEHESITQYWITDSIVETRMIFSEPVSLISTSGFPYPVEVSNPSNDSVTFILRWNLDLDDYFLEVNLRNGSFKDRAGNDVQANGPEVSFKYDSSNPKVSDIQALEENGITTKDSIVTFDVLFSETIVGFDFTNGFQLKNSTLISVDTLISNRKFRITARATETGLVTLKVVDTMAVDLAGRRIQHTQDSAWVYYDDLQPQLTLLSQDSLGTNGKSVRVLLQFNKFMGNELPYSFNTACYKYNCNISSVSHIGENAYALYLQTIDEGWGYFYLKDGEFLDLVGNPVPGTEPFYFYNDITPPEVKINPNLDYNLPNDTFQLRIWTSELLKSWQDSSFTLENAELTDIELVNDTIFATFSVINVGAVNVTFGSENITDTVGNELIAFPSVRFAYGGDDQISPTVDLFADRTLYGKDDRITITAIFSEPMDKSIGNYSGVSYLNVKSYSREWVNDSTFKLVFYHNRNDVFEARFFCDEGKFADWAGNGNLMNTDTVVVRVDGDIPYIEISPLEADTMGREWVKFRIRIDDPTIDLHSDFFGTNAGILTDFETTDSGQYSIVLRPDSIFGRCIVTNGGPYSVFLKSDTLAMDSAGNYLSTGHFGNYCFPQNEFIQPQLFYEVIEKTVSPERYVLLNVRTDEPVITYSSAPFASDHAEVQTVQLSDTTFQVELTNFNFTSNCISIADPPLCYLKLFYMTDLAGNYAIDEPIQTFCFNDITGVEPILVDQHINLHYDRSLKKLVVLSDYSDGELMILNGLGQQLTITQLSQGYNSEIDLSSFPAGTYIVVATTSQKVSSAKFVMIR